MYHVTICKDDKYKIYCQNTSTFENRTSKNYELPLMRESCRETLVTKINHA